VRSKATKPKAEAINTRMLERKALYRIFYEKREANITISLAVRKVRLQEELLVIADKKCLGHITSI